MSISGISEKRNATVNLTRTVAFLLFCAAILFATPVFAVTEDETVRNFIKYLPRDQTMQTVRVNYKAPKPQLTPSETCKIKVITDAQDCFYCSNLWQTCPDCCVVTGSDGNLHRKCTKYDDPRYDCTKVPFKPPECAAVRCAQIREKPCDDPIPGCQENGCPSLAPDGNCTFSQGIWTCNRGDLEPFVPCDNVCSAIVGCPAPPYYSKSQDPKTKAWYYTPTDKFRGYVNRCLDTAREWEQCKLDIDCCEQKLCNGLGLAACLGCEERIADEVCLNFSKSGCENSIKEYNDFISDPHKASRCFAPLEDTSMTYTFVAKSNEKVTVIWQLQAECPQRNKISPMKNILFYSMIRILEGNTPSLSAQQAPVFESPYHVRSMHANFAISALSTVPPDRLKAGKSYTVQIFYFIPPSSEASVPQNLAMELSWAELIVLRNRD